MWTRRETHAQYFRQTGTSEPISSVPEEHPVQWPRQPILWRACNSLAAITAAKNQRIWTAARNRISRIAVCMRLVGKWLREESARLPGNGQPTLTLAR